MILAIMMIYEYKDLLDINKVLLLLNEHGDPSFLFLKFKFLYKHNKSIDKIFSVQVL